MQGQNCGMNILGAVAQFKNDVGLLDCETCIMTSDGHFLVVAARQLLLRKKEGACGESVERGTAE